jgi:hypothetical protein
MRRLLRRRGARAQEARWYGSSQPSLSLTHTAANTLLLPGVKNFDVSLESQTATVTAEENLDYATVLEKIKKTGKAVNSGEADGVAQAV